jgi:hypothetical protein
LENHAKARAANSSTSGFDKNEGASGGVAISEVLGIDRPQKKIGVPDSLTAP